MELFYFSSNSTLKLAGIVAYVVSFSTRLHDRGSGPFGSRIRAGMRTDIVPRRVDNGNHRFFERNGLAFELKHREILSEVEVTRLPPTGLHEIWRTSFQDRRCGA
jgi:hypothetical protein